ncbi:MAG TPA: DUF5829 family protein [Bryobacteraceae bacterium]|nr:DUF5829 family protein [Bryobacteraceae bacterium]
MKLSLSLLVATLGVLAALLAQTAPPVYFNHVTIYVPPAAYTALLQSDFLRNEFSGSHEQTVQRNGGAWSYTGIFLYGQHTYFEIFKAGPQMGSSGAVMVSPGQLLFNMWIDDRRQLPLFKDRVAEERGSARQIVTTRDAKNQPAYDSVSPVGVITPSPGVLSYTVVKGYYPDGQTREKRFEDRYRPERYLHDITGLTLTVNEAERDLLLRDFRAYSYHIEADGEKRVASGPEVVFTLTPSKSGEPRTLVVDLSMNRPITANRVIKFENTSELHIQASVAKWIFTFPSE